MSKQHTQSKQHTHNNLSNDNNRSQRRLFIVLIIMGIFAAIQAIGGFMSGSLALLSESVHMLSDFIALLLSWIAFHYSKKPSDHRRSYGYQRFQIIVALINSLVLFVIVIFIIIEAIRRFYMENIQVNWQVMLPVAFAGLLVNIIAFLVLYSAKQDNLNMRSAVLHILGDLLGSIAAIVAALFIMYTGWMQADPILSIFVAALLLNSTYRVSKESIHILLEGTPLKIDHNSVQQYLVDHIEEIIEIHHMHIWSLSEDKIITTLHAVIKNNAKIYNVICDVKRALSEHFGITHSTIEVEYYDQECADLDFKAHK